MRWRGATSSSSHRRRPGRRFATTRRFSTPCSRIPRARALYLFPTKALAQDQLAELHAMCEVLAVNGDKDRRVHLRRRHAAGCTPNDSGPRAPGAQQSGHAATPGILPHHPRWAKLFENLRYIVIDELHAYRGVFGSHLCNVLRRIRRICRHYGSNPVFICSSATIANPRELAERLTERPFETGRPERRSARREVFRLCESARGQPSAWHPPLISCRDATRCFGVLEAQSAAHCVRPEPSHDRDIDYLL